MSDIGIMLLLAQDSFTKMIVPNAFSIKNKKERGFVSERGVIDCLGLYKLPTMVSIIGVPDTQANIDGYIYYTDKSSEGISIKLGADDKSIQVATNAKIKKNKGNKVGEEDIPILFKYMHDTWKYGNECVDKQVIENYFTSPSYTSMIGPIILMVHIDAKRHEYCTGIFQLGNLPCKVFKIAFCTPENQSRKGRKRIHSSFKLYDVNNKLLAEVKGGQNAFGRGIWMPAKGFINHPCIEVVHKNIKFSPQSSYAEKCRKLFLTECN